MSNLLKTVPCSVRPSARLLRVCAAFGIAVESKVCHRSPRPRGAAVMGSPLNLPASSATLDRTLHRGELALLLGPSGSGKTSLLLSLQRRLRAAHRRVILAAPPAQSRKCIIDLIRAPIPRALRILGAAGLADATLLARTPVELSAGERARLSLAIAMAHCERAAEKSPRVPVTLLIDEIGSTLDRPTAHTIARTLRRWLARPDIARRVRVVCATAHDDIAIPLAPYLIVSLSLADVPRFVRAARPD